jgi:tRNA(Ile2) C34 agmatinyltransferase TiaS
MTETPKCPYCGAEMLDDSYTWTCPKCYSNSPVVIWDEEKVKGMTEEEKMAYAREAALHRAEIKKDEKEEAK